MTTYKTKYNDIGQTVFIPKYKLEVTNFKGEWKNYPITNDIASSKELTLDLMKRIKSTFGIGSGTRQIRMMEIKDEN